MYRFLLTTALATLFLSGGVQASVGLAQDFWVGARNGVVWTGGVGSARSDVQGSFSQTQRFSDHAAGLSARQTERGSLTQTATASGGGLGLARQTVTARGGQDLLVDTTHGFPSRAQQDMAVRLDTRLWRPLGVGTVNGTQTYTGAQEQAVTTPSGTSSQCQAVDIRQSGSIGTQTSTDPAVRNTIAIGLHQTQGTTGQ